uniref:Zinc finger PHD-type domain-containing protein n=1 Tax=Aegilops tauschii subsp. strangulata TaxID=200361 RepID=A0A453M2C8_AEGTS
QGLRTRRPTVAVRSGDEEDFDNDGDDDYSDQNDYDYICKYDASHNHGSGDDKSSDDYSCTDDDSNDDGDDIDNDGGGGGDATDNLCAICDNGGKLLCCEGQCKRSFHPREKDGRESTCETLGLTSAQLQEIDHYLCKNCEYKQHQCFSCGDLEPSDGPNAKVFQCYKASCGHFYHPSCIAKLLEPDDTDGACELERRIAAGMSFTCPAHWCSECRTMEDSTQPELWLAACRRCPVSYHKICFPRSISFERKRGTSVRAWHLGDRIIIYCGSHKLEAELGAPSRDHIKLPSSTEMDTVGTHCIDQIKSTPVQKIYRTRNLAKKKTEVTGKRKMNTDQGSTGTAELSKKVCREEADQIQTVDMNNLREDKIPKGRGVLEKETIRLNQAHNDELEKLIVEEQAEEDESNTKSGEERETRRRENTYGEKEKTPVNNSNKFGLPDGRFSSGSDGDREVDGSHACQQELKSPHCNDNNKATGIDTSSEKSGKRQRQEEQATDGNMLDLERNNKKFHMETGRDAHQSPQRLHNHKKTDARQSSDSSSKNHPLGNDDQRSSMTSEYKSREGRGSSREEWRNNMRENSYRGGSPSRRRNSQNRSRRHSPEGRRTEYRNSHHRSNNQHRYEQHRHDDYFKCRDDYSKRRDVDTGGRRSSRREDHSSDGGRRRSSHREDHSDGGRRRSSHREDHSSDGGRRRSSHREDHSSDGGRRRSSHREDHSSDGDRRRSSHREDHSSDGDIGGRRLSPQQSALPSGNFGTGLSPPSHPTTEYGASRRHGSPPYQRSKHAASGSRGPYMNPRGSGPADYEMERRSVPLHHDVPNVEDEEYTGQPLNMVLPEGIAPVNTYSLRGESPGAYGPGTDAGMCEETTFRGGRFADHGVRSDYPRSSSMNAEDRAFAAGSVTDRYVPRLDRTNHPVRVDGYLPDYPVW